jgi:acyl-CoA thioesterase
MRGAAVRALARILMGMRMTALDDAFALTPLGPSEWSGRADPAYEADNGMFGGWTAAVLLKAVLGDAGAQGTPSTLTVHYLKRVEGNSPVTLKVRPIGGGRSLSFWHAEITPQGQDDISAFATVVLANRHETDGFADIVMPNVPAPETIEDFYPPVTFGKRTPMRGVKGFPPWNHPDSQSIAWVRETSGRALDYIQLAYLADAYPPRIWYRTQMRPSSTVTLSVYFHAAADELAAIGDDFVLTDARGTRAEHSTIGCKADLWSRQGKLLATTEQLHWFK